MWKIEEVEKELKEYGLTIHDLEPGKDEPKWMRNWRQGKRLSTFEMSMKLQFLQGKQKEKERKNESVFSDNNTSNNLNAIENTSNDDSKSEKSGENKMDNNKEKEITNESDNSSPQDSENKSVDIEDLDDDQDEMEPELDPLEELFQDHQRKDDTHTYKGFYLENAIVKIIDKKSKKGGKGMKSKIVNEALKIVFKQKGWMD